MTRRISRCVQGVLLFIATSLAGCAALIDQTGNGNLESVLGALTFQAAERSGDATDHSYQVVLLPRYYDDSNADGIRRLRDLLAKDSGYLAAFDSCTQLRPASIKKAKKKAALNPFLAAFFDPSGIVTAVGNLVYSQIVSNIQSRIARLKEAGSKSHVYRVQALAGYDWDDMSCIVLSRELSPEGEKAEIKRLGSASQIERVRMIAVLQRRSLGYQGSVFRPIFLRVNYSNAQTENNAKGVANIGVAITLALHSFVTSKEGLNTVVEVGSQTFAPITAALGAQIKDICPAYKDADAPGGVLIPCNGETGMLPNPPKLVPFQLTLVVTETGSALTTAAAAEKHFKAVSDAIKPTYDDFVKVLAQRVATK